MKYFKTVLVSPNFLALKMITDYNVFTDLNRLKNPERLESVVHGLMTSLLAQGRAEDGTKLACHVFTQDPK